MERALRTPTGAVLAVLMLLGLACGRDASAPRSALLVTLDTTRRDALGAYGGRAATPNLDRLAEEGALFEEAHSVVPITLPSHASMLTGLYPFRHRVRDNGAGALGEAATTLAELARARGFETAAFLASIILSRPFGLAQGFDVFDSPKRGEGSAEARALHGGERSAPTVVDHALDWLSTHDATRPFFLWVHFYDPHAPYEFPPGATNTDPYLAEVEAADQALGRLFAALEARGLYDDLTVLAVADHGESFGDHGEPTHATLCYEATLAVPLVLRAPGRVTPGTRRAEVVSVVDVFPTLAEAMGLTLPEVPGGLDGVSLLGAARPGRAVYFESYYGYFSHHWSPLAGVLDGQGKYIHSSRPELYRLGSDPDELDDRAAAEPDAARAYLRRLTALADRPALPEESAAIDEDLLAGIQQLGYSGMAEESASLPAPGAPSDLPAPRDRVDWFEAYERAQGLLREEDLRGAGAVYEGVLAENPLDFKALEELAAIRVQEGHVEDALALFRRLVSEGPGRARHYFALGQCLRATGDVEGALPMLERAVALAPSRKGYTRALADLRRVLAER